MEGFDIEITPAELVPLIQVFEIKNYQKFTMLGYESDTPFTAGIHESRGSHVTYKLREIDGIVLMESIMPIINISKADPYQIGGDLLIKLIHCSFSSFYNNCFNTVVHFF
jgi:hypothetical protein